MQSLQAAITAAEARADAKDNEAASAKEAAEAQSSELRAAHAEAAALKKQAMDLMEKIALLDKQTKVRGSLTEGPQYKDSMPLSAFPGEYDWQCSFIHCSPNLLWSPKVMLII